MHLDCSESGQYDIPHLTGKLIYVLQELCFLIQDSVNLLHGVYSRDAPHTSAVTQAKVGKKALVHALEAMPHLTMAISHSTVSMNPYLSHCQA